MRVSLMILTDVTKSTSKPMGAVTFKCVNAIFTDTVVHTFIGNTIINICNFNNVFVMI